MRPQGRTPLHASPLYRHRGRDRTRSNASTSDSVAPWLSTSPTRSPDSPALAPRCRGPDMPPPPRARPRCARWPTRPARWECTPRRVTTSPRRARCDPTPRACIPARSPGTPDRPCSPWDGPTGGSRCGPAPNSASRGRKRRRTRDDPSRASRGRPHWSPRRHRRRRGQDAGVDRRRQAPTETDGIDARSPRPARGLRTSSSRTTQPWTRRAPSPIGSSSTTPSTRASPTPVTSASGLTQPATPGLASRGGGARQPKDLRLARRHPRGAVPRRRR